MPSMFELVYSGDNAVHITVTNSYTIVFRKAPEIQSILGFESRVLEKGVYNPRRYFLSSVCNQGVVTNDETFHILSMSIGYDLYLEFIDALGSEMVKVLPLVLMTIEEEYVELNVQEDGWYFDRESEDMTMNGFGWTPWFKLSPSTHSLCMERSVDGSVFDPNGASLPDVTNNQGLVR